MTTTSATTETAPAESITLALVDAIERTWAAIRRRHPDVPRVVVTIGSGTIGAARGAVTLGHYAGARWVHQEDGDLPELFVGGEGLQRGAVDVLGTLLHESAHGLAAARDIKDTSRQGRWHNARYKALGEEVGLTLAKDERIGWSLTSVPDETAQTYAAEVERLAAAITAYRRSEHIARLGPGTGGAGGEDEDGGATGKDTRASSNNGRAAVCRCEPPRRIRVAPTVLALGAITCGCCKSEFLAGQDEEEQPR
ncbi:hypothetical protein [Actinomadura montaniterrae]|uniref:SprT family zinc-dependent metalloprotease n=1 Tax=Actinomadura montaniterrae TaxID=1803903 RepID=A0A6L3VRJ5_9ACTN|nr:hypothetical protein [Actinomadura montaniterrae]KAB2376994.1 hypothetical protein F9B16_24480 [Actinomadura montaniterrae]